MAEKRIHEKEDEQRSIQLEDDFVCSVCFEILLDPTTLSCGHTFCRYCLANWWKSSSKAECLQCRRPFTEFPKVNFTLRNHIEKLYPERVKERRKQQNSAANYSETIELFEQHSERSNVNARSMNRRMINCGSICFILPLLIAFIVLVTIAVKVMTAGSEVLLHAKPIREWTTEDVAYWVGERGPWAKGVYDVRFKKAGIDGDLLLKIKENDLLGPPINMDLGLHRRVFMNSLQSIHEHGSKKPNDFWDYKAANRAKSVFLLFGLRQFPRTMMVYLYVFDYADSFLVFMHQTMKSHKTDAPNMGKASQNDILLSWEELWSFFSYLFTIPYYLIGLFAYNYLHVNYWISKVIIIHAAILTACEMTQLGWLIKRGGYKTLPAMMLKTTALATGFSLLMKILSPFLPFFVYDLIFYWMFFIGPCFALNRLCKTLSRQQQQQHHQQQQQRRDDVIEAENANRWQFNFQIRRD